MAGNPVDFDFMVFVFAVIENFDGIAFFDLAEAGGDFDFRAAGGFDAVPGKGGCHRKQGGDEDQFFHGTGSDVSENAMSSNDGLCRHDSSKTARFSAGEKGNP